MSSSDVAVSVRGLSKSYTIAHKGEKHVTLAESVLAKARRPFARSVQETFWALNEVSFDIKRGNVVGIIGRNGAGKSTLLKILSRITEPTTGEVQLYGRVGSLLEVGTGFHPELTGRENIYLNGNILGMRQREVARCFDAIVDFADVAAFLDTPVKRYSSGMYTRLAFAVAAHLESEILLIDEVLAVGDHQFQRKCLGKMSELATAGRTILFVSHNLSAVERLCTSVIRMERGKVLEFSDDPRAVISRQVNDQGQAKATAIWERDGGSCKSAWFTPIRVYLTDEAGELISEPQKNSTTVTFCVDATVEAVDTGLVVGYAIYSADGQLLYWSCTIDAVPEKWPVVRLGKCTFRTAIPPRLLNEGTYRVELIAGLHFRQWLVTPGQDSPAVFFTIRGGLSDSPMFLSARPGLLAPVFPWEIIPSRS